MTKLPHSIDSWHYEKVLADQVPGLLEVAPAETLEMLCGLLDDAIDDGLRSGDYSHIWRPAIEDHTANHGFSEIEDLLVTAVRDAAEYLIAHDSTRLIATLEGLGERDYSIFRRLELHLLRLYGKDALSLVTQRLTNTDIFHNSDLHHEYVLLLVACWPHLTPETQSNVLSLIDSGPRLGSDREVSEERLRRWTLNQLYPLNGLLPVAEQSQLDALLAEFGEPEHPDLPSVMTSWVGPTSPQTVDELRTAPRQEVVTFLKEWIPPSEHIAPSPLGLARNLAEVVKGDPMQWAAASPDLIDADATYVGQFFSGLNSAIGDGVTYEWGAVLDLADWVMVQERDIAGRSEDSFDVDGTWGPSRANIARLLSSGLSDGDTEIPFELRERVWRVIAALLDDPEPTVEHEATYGGANMAPAELALNTVRPIAMQAAMNYGLWIHRHHPVATERRSPGLEVMPEVRVALESHLDPTLDPSLAVRSVYGTMLPWLSLLDREWTIDSLDRILPRDQGSRDLRNAAWDTYLIFRGPFDDTVPILEEEYRYSLRNLDSFDSDGGHLGSPETRLVEHIVTLYWRGQSDLADEQSLISELYRTTPVQLRAHVISFIGRLLYNARNDDFEIPEEALDRLRLLWQTRRAEVASHSDSEASELVDFGWWFAARWFDDSWSLDEATAVLDSAGWIEPDHLVVERLAALAPTHGIAVAACFEAMIEGAPKGWEIVGWQTPLRSSLAVLLDSEEATVSDAAHAIVNRLAARGFTQYSDLL